MHSQPGPLQRLPQADGTVFQPAGEVLSGQPHRIEHLAKALEYVLSHSGVWCATGSDIIASYRQQTQPATQAGQKDKP